MTPRDRQRAIDEWLTEIDTEVARRAEKKDQKASAARDRLFDELEHMGERLLAGPDITPLVEELMSANGDRQEIEAICQRQDMSHAARRPYPFEFLSV
jgi:hypothetical protein